MSYDLAFWVDSRDNQGDSQSVYADLLAGHIVDGLSQFKTRSVLTALEARFPGLEPPPTEGAGPTFWESPDGDAVFEFSWSSQHLVATARGAYTNDKMNAIIDVCVDVGDGRLYDPQTNERFDSA